MRLLVVTATGIPPYLEERVPAYERVRRYGSTGVFRHSRLLIQGPEHRNVGGAVFRKPAAGVENPFPAYLSQNKLHHGFSLVPSAFNKTSVL